MATDPFQSASFLQSGRSAQTGFRERECYKAAFGDLTQPAMDGR